MIDFGAPYIRPQLSVGAAARRIAPLSSGANVVYLFAWILVGAGVLVALTRLLQLATRWSTSAMTAVSARRSAWAERLRHHLLRSRLPVDRLATLGGERIQAKLPAPAIQVSASWVFVA